MWGTENLEMAEQSVDFPGGSDGKRIRLQCGRPGFDPCIGKVLWRRERLLTPVFLPGEFQGQRSLAGYSPWGYKESDMTEHAHMHACTLHYYSPERTSRFL